MQWKRSESVEQPFSSLPRSHHVNEVPTTTCLHCHYVHAILTMPLLLSNCVPIQPCPHSVGFFEHVQSSTTSFTSMKTLLPSYQFLLRSYYNVLQVLTASIQFFKDLVRTWLSVKGVWRQIVDDGWPTFSHWVITVIGNFERIVVKWSYHKKFINSLPTIVSFADNLCKKFGPKSGPTLYWPVLGLW